MKRTVVLLSGLWNEDHNYIWCALNDSKIGGFKRNRGEIRVLGGEMTGYPLFSSRIYFNGLIELKIDLYIKSRTSLLVARKKNIGNVLSWFRKRLVAVYFTELPGFDFFLFCLLFSIIFVFKVVVVICVNRLILISAAKHNDRIQLSGFATAPIHQSFYLVIWFKLTCETKFDSHCLHRLV